MSRGQTLLSKREHPERMFLILIPKLGMHDSRFLYDLSNFLVSKSVQRG